MAELTLLGDWNVVVKRVKDAPSAHASKQPTDGFQSPALAKVVHNNVTTKLILKAA